MTETYDPSGQCWNKERFVSEAEARAHRAMMVYYYGRDYEVVFYECPHCGFFHYARKRPATGEQIG